MDGIKIIRDEKQFPVCSGYNCNKLLNIDNENVFNDSYVPMGLVIFPREIQISINDNEDYIQVIENENNEIQNKLMDNLLKSHIRYKASNKSCSQKPKVKNQKTRKLKI